MIMDSTRLLKAAQQQDEIAAVAKLSLSLASGLEIKQITFDTEIAEGSEYYLELYYNALYPQGGWCGIKGNGARTFGKLLQHLNGR